tara:strand:- start:109 stop:903 length:795 start_codon:yes stop_codon:yes gene_type:complete
MPVSKTNRTYASRYKTDVSVDQTTNTGFDSTARLLVSGDGASSAVSLSDDQLKVKAINDDTTGTFTVSKNAGNFILSVDTDNDLVKAGLSQVNALTLFKDMGLFAFSPTAGVHNPLIANNMMFSHNGTDIEEDTSMFSSGTDPAETLDLSTNGTAIVAVACYWYLENNITLDSVRCIATSAGSNTLKFHLFAYTLDVSSNLGDLSGGTVHAHDHSVTTTNTSLKTELLTLDEADIDANKIVIGFVESNATDDVTVALNIQYHIR